MFYLSLNYISEKGAKTMKFKKFQGYFLVGVVILAVVGVFSSFAGAATKNDSIGFVDMDRLQNELPDFSKLKDIAKDKTAELNYFRGYLFSQQQSAAKDLEKKATADKVGKSADEQAAIDKRLQDDNSKTINDVNSQIQKKYDEFQQYINDQKTIVLEKVKKTIAAVADDQKLTLVLEKNVCFYGATDITQAVIDKAKKQEAAASKTGKVETKTDKK
jgi:Skp family chaperone for outer membrane proteins